MLHSLRSKKELREEMVLDRTFEVVNLREWLKLLRDSKTQLAVDNMEICLDGAVLSIARSLEHCKPSTKGVIECELKKLWLYRQDSPGRSANWLDGQDPTTRDRLLEMKAAAEKVLSKYKTQTT